MSDTIRERDLGQVTPAPTDEVRLVRNGQSVRGPALDLPIPAAAEDRLHTLEMGQSAGQIGYATKAAMDADLAHPEGTLALVTNDATSTNNGTYRKTGASGSGSWVLSADRMTTVNSDIAASRLSSGDLAASTTPAFGPANGATAILDVTRPIGISVPDGSSGQNASLVPFFTLSQLEVDSLVGAELIITVTYQLSATWNKSLTGAALQIVRDGSLVTGGTYAGSTVSGSRMTRQYRYTVQAGDQQLGPIIQISSSTTTGAQSITLETWSYRINTQAAGKTATIEDQADLLRLNRVVYPRIEATKGSFGPLLATGVEVQVAVANGATVRTSGGRSVGFTIPSGSTGHLSSMELWARISAQRAALLAGRKVRVTAGFVTSDGWDRSIAFVAKSYTASGSRQPTRVTTKNVQKALGYRVIEIEYTLTGDETILAPYLQVTTNATRSSEHWIQFDSLAVVIAETPAGAVTSSDENERQIALRIAEDLVAQLTAGPVQVTAAASGGDFSSAAAANAAITDATKAKRYVVAIAPGTYAGDKNWQTKDYIDFIGADAERTTLLLDNPDSTPPATIQNDVPLWLRAENKLKGVSVIARNARYAIHRDNINYKNRTVVIEDCHVEHLGNQGARDYQAANGGDPNAVWTATNAWGSGTASGETVIARRSRFRSPGNTWSVHNNDTFEAPSHNIIERCEIICTSAGGTCIAIQSLGSGVKDVFDISGSKIVGDITYDTKGWLPAALVKRPANRAEWKVTGSGNTPAVFRHSTASRALKIESASTSGTSAVVVSGTAVPVLFGGTVYSMPGAGGIKGYVYGWGDISSTPDAASSLGSRLGDRSGSPVTLTVAVDGGAPVNIVFSANYTGTTNASVLAIINAALSGAVASEYDITGRYRPSMLDEETSLLNNTAEGVLMGMAVVRGSSTGTVRKMTATDSPSLFLGIAWEDIYPGQWGRVKFRGHVALVDLLRSDAAAIATGDTFSVDASQPGFLVKGGGMGLLRAIRSNAVAVA
ncbi:MAG: hypothetical protein J7507_12155 [Pseudoxanthomonas sp.]|nr:hypothetical protein [Pseudoxanthomonas sp.]